MEEYLFTTKYKKGDTLYYVNVQESLIRKIKLRTVDETYMVGVVNKSDTVFIGKDKKNCLYDSMLDAKQHIESSGKTANIELLDPRPPEQEESGDDNE